MKEYMREQRRRAKEVRQSVQGICEARPNRNWEDGTIEQEKSKELKEPDTAEGQ